MKRLIATMFAATCLISDGGVTIAQPIEVVIPHETPDVKMPTGDDARGIPMPQGTFGREVYRARRRQVMEQMGGGVAVIFGADRIGGSSRQDMNFYFLTGLAYEEGAALVLAPDEPLWNEYLFLKPVNPEVNRWDGERAILGRAVELGTGFARVMRTNSLPGVLAGAVLRSEEREMVFLGPVVGYKSDIPKALDVSQEVTSRIPGSGVRMDHRLLPLMRQVHDEAELELIQKAIDITGEGLARAMMQVRDGMREYELKTVIENGFRRGGARRRAFESIVGSGPNGAVLHYRDDSRPMHDGELVLCDVGAEFEQYAADVTRTFPVSGRFSSRQREVYEVVLRAQEAGIAACKPGALMREDVHMAARKVIEDAGYTDYFFHGTSHFLGLEVHDAGLSREPLVAGTIITVEPGIYIAEEKLGIRIEDDVLITEDGPVVISRHIPRQIDEIEALMAKGPQR